MSQPKGRSITQFIITEMLQDEKVGSLWKNFIALPQYELNSKFSEFEARNSAFQAYALARDEFLGYTRKEVKPIEIQ